MAKSTIDLIYYGALDAFSKKGFAETTMEEIAEAASVSKGTLYYNFKSKEELYAYIMQRGIDQLTQEIAGAFSKYADIRQKWANIVQAHFDFFEKNRSFFQLFIQNIWGADIRGGMSLQAILSNYFQLLDEEILHTQNQGWIPGDLDYQSLSSCMFGMIMVPAARAIIRNQPINDEKRIKTVTFMVLNLLEGDQ